MDIGKGPDTLFEQSTQGLTFKYDRGAPSVQGKAGKEGKEGGVQSGVKAPTTCMQRLATALGFKGKSAKIQLANGEVPAAVVVIDLLAKVGVLISSDYWSVS